MLEIVETVPVMWMKNRVDIERSIRGMQDDLLSAIDLHEEIPRCIKMIVGHNPLTTEPHIHL